VLAGVSALTGDWLEFSVKTIQTLMISGLISIFLGDTVLFSSLQRLRFKAISCYFLLDS
jgi:hypothetical protein